MPDCCPSLDHFVLSEKFRAVDDSYRRHLLTLSAHDLYLESLTHHEFFPRSDWKRICAQVYFSGLIMQCRQHSGLADRIFDRFATITPSFTNKAVREFQDHFKNITGINSISILGETFTPNSQKVIDTSLIRSRCNEILSVFQSGIEDQIETIGHQNNLAISRYHKDDISGVIGNSDYVVFCGSADTMSRYRVEVEEITRSKGKVLIYTEAVQDVV